MTPALTGSNASWPHASGSTYIGWNQFRTPMTPQLADQWVASNMLSAMQAVVVAVCLRCVVGTHIKPVFVIQPLVRCMQFDKGLCWMVHRCDPTHQYTNCIQA